MPEQQLHLETQNPPDTIPQESYGKVFVMESGVVYAGEREKLRNRREMVTPRIGRAVVHHLPMPRPVSYSEGITLAEEQLFKLLEKQKEKQKEDARSEQNDDDLITA